MTGRASSVDSSHGSDAESVDSNSVGGGGDAQRRMSGRKKKGVSYKEGRSKKLKSTEEENEHEFSQVTSSVTITEETTTTTTTTNSSDPNISTNNRSVLRSSHNNVMLSGASFNNQTDDILNTSGSVNVSLDINSKFYKFQLSRLAYQLVYDASEKFVPERVEMVKNQIVMLSSAENESRFSFFDSQTLELVESSEFPFSVVDFCVGKKSMFFTNGKQLFVWKLENRDQGYDTLDLPEVEVSIDALSAVNENVGLIISRNYSYYESVLVYKIVENKKSETLNVMKQHLSDLNCKVDPFSFAMLKDHDDKFVVMNQVKRQLAMYSFVSKTTLSELMKFTLPQAGIDSVRVCQGPVSRSLLAVLNHKRVGTSLVFLDWGKKTTVTLLTSDQSDTSRSMNVNNPIECSFGQSKLAMIHHENFQDRQRLSLFSLEMKQKSSKMKKIVMFLFMTILVCIVAVALAYFYGDKLVIW
ncbi:uncharacterized protein LOC134855174 isoform X2 [Symsagittifera roscoffensis]|uniref:uncharacterized protein LOC134855174 isoform X2 n=1 Tax=Symsagittifera roscoffensis TaxID=84072 RepID=UPI00307B3AAE